MDKDEYRSEVRDGMLIDWNVPVRMPDRTVLRADVYRPPAEGRYPVIMTHGPYAKGLAFQAGFAGMWTGRRGCSEAPPPSCRAHSTARTCCCR